MERRLAAVLAADVVGYSRLMGEDEVDTLARGDGRVWRTPARKLAGLSGPTGSVQAPGGSGSLLGRPARGRARVRLLH